MKVIPNFEELTKALPKNMGEVEFHSTEGYTKDKYGDPIPNTYWNGKGFYQYQYDKLYELLIPAQDQASTIQGEMLRCASRLYYEFCNNGNGNALEQDTQTCGDCFGSGKEEAEECSECDGTGNIDTEDEDGDYIEEVCDCCEGSGYLEEEDCQLCDGTGYVDCDFEIEKFYNNMIEFLELHLDSQDEISDLRDFLEDESRKDLSYDFSEKEMRIYDRVVDQLMHQLLQSPILTPNPNYKPLEAII